MSLVLHWYDAFCFAIVAASVLASCYALWKTERSGEKDEEKSMYESLLDDISDGPTSTPATASVVRHKAHLSSSQLWDTSWRGLHPGWLLGTRVISFFVLAGFLSWDIQEWGASIFIYYTEWTFALVMLYFAIGSFTSAHGCWLYYAKDGTFPNAIESQVEGDIEETSAQVSIGKHHSDYYQELSLQRAGFWGYLMQTAYQTSAGAVVLTDIVFWGIIVPLLSNERLGLNLLMGCMHTVNFALLLLDSSINQLPFPWFRLAYVVLWSSAYVVFQWLIHLFGFSWWPYPFLELSTPSAPLWYFILAVFHIACYGLYALIMRVKDSLFSRLFPDLYIRP